MSGPLTDPTDAHLAELTERAKAVQAQALRVHDAYSFPSMNREEAIRTLLDLCRDLLP